MAPRFETLATCEWPLDFGFPDDPDPIIRALGCTVKKGLLPPTSALPTSAPSSIVPGTASRSILSELCAEVLHEILQYLSLEDLEQLRQCQQALNTNVMAFPPYRKVRRYAPGLVRAMTATRQDTFATPEAMLDALYAGRCVRCKERAPFIFLPTLERACYECLDEWRHFRMVPISAVRQLFNLTHAQLAKIPKMLSLDCTVPILADQVWPRRRFWLVNASVAFEWTARFQTTEVLNVVKDVRDRCDKLAQRSSLAGFWWDAFQFDPRPTSEPFLGPGGPDPAVFQSGFLCRESHSFQPAMWCAGCQEADDLSTMVEGDVYTPRELLAHSGECKAAKKVLRRKNTQDETESSSAED